MLWDIIRDFFVVNIFGGYASDNSVYSGMIGSLVDSGNDYALNENFTSDLYVLFGDQAFYNFSDGTHFNGMLIGDYLSTTFTIITFIILFVIACLFIRWIFRITKGSLKW